MNKMLALSLTDYVSALQKAGLFSAFIGNEKEKELLIKQLTFDSRKVCSDCLFVCKGKRFLPSFLDDAFHHLKGNEKSLRYKFPSRF